MWSCAAFPLVNVENIAYFQQVNNKSILLSSVDEDASNHILHVYMRVWDFLWHLEIIKLLGTLGFDS